MHEVSATSHPSHLCSTVFMVQLGEFEPFRLGSSSWSSTTSSLVFSRRFCSTADAIKCSDVRSGQHRLVDMSSARHRTLVLFLASLLVAIRGHALALAAGLFSGVAGAIRVALRPDFHAIQDGVNTRSRQGMRPGAATARQTRMGKIKRRPEHVQCSPSLPTKPPPCPKPSWPLGPSAARSEKRSRSWFAKKTFPPRGPPGRSKRMRAALTCMLLLAVGAPACLAFAPHSMLWQTAFTGKGVRHVARCTSAPTRILHRGARAGGLRGATGMFTGIVEEMGQVVALQAENMAAWDSPGTTVEGVTLTIGQLSDRRQPGWFQTEGICFEQLPRSPWRAPTRDAPFLSTESA